MSAFHKLKAYFGMVPAALMGLDAACRPVYVTTL